MYEILPCYTDTRRTDISQRSPPAPPCPLLLPLPDTPKVPHQHPDPPPSSIAASGQHFHRHLYLLSWHRRISQVFFFSWPSETPPPWVPVRVCRRGAGTGRPVIRGKGRVRYVDATADSPGMRTTAKGCCRDVIYFYSSRPQHPFP